MVQQYEFIGNQVTLFGFVGIVSSLFIVFTVFQQYNSSPIRK